MSFWWGDHAKRKRAPYPAWDVSKSSHHLRNLRQLGRTSAISKSGPLWLDGWPMTTDHGIMVFNNSVSGFLRSWDSSWIRHTSLQVFSIGTSPPGSSRSRANYDSSSASSPKDCITRTRGTADNWRSLCALRAILAALDRACKFWKGKITSNNHILQNRVGHHWPRHSLQHALKRFKVVQLGSGISGNPAIAAIASPSFSLSCSLCICTWNISVCVGAVHVCLDIHIQSYTYIYIYFTLW